MKKSNLLNENGQKDYFLIQCALKNNDQKAYAELMNRYRNSLYYIIYKMIGSKDDAEDLLFESFEKAFKNLRHYTPDFSFSTWLFRIAINNCIDYLRKKHKQEVTSTEISEEYFKKIVKQEPSNDQSPEEQLIRKQRFEFLKKCIDGLSPKYRIVIELKYLHENTYEEISEKTNLPVGTVKAQLFRGKKILYDRLRKSIG